MMKADGSDPPVRISIVLPTLDEEAALPETLKSVLEQERPPRYELLLADGGSSDRTVAVFRDRTGDGPVSCAGARVVRSARRGRAAQMNEGARAARGSVLLFLHADTRLPPGALAAIDAALQDVRLVGGGFRHRFDESRLILRLISAWSTARARLVRVHYGDQAMFVRRDVFERIGGFPDLPLFEDLRLAQALRREGLVRTLPLRVVTSARRLLRGGLVRTGLQFASLRLRFALGVDAAKLRRRYPDVR
jgi:rSAM/selenodomain-associated transferase 2